MNPQDGSYWYRYGNKCYEEKRWEEAAIAFAKAGKHGYDCRIPVSGECYYKLGKYNEALMAYADAYSYHYAVLGVIARTLRKLERYGEEEVVLKQHDILNYYAWRQMEPRESYSTDLESLLIREAHKNVTLLHRSSAEVPGYEFETIILDWNSNPVPGNETLVTRRIVKDLAAKFANGWQFDSDYRIIPSIATRK